MIQGKDTLDDPGWGDIEWSSVYKTESSDRVSSIIHAHDHRIVYEALFATKADKYDNRKQNIKKVQLATTQIAMTCGQKCNMK